MIDALPQQAREMTLRDYLDILRRRKTVVLATLLAVILLAVAYLVLTRPVYQSTARILVEDESATITRRDANDPFGDLAPTPTPNVVTQIELLQGENLLAQAYKNAGVPRTAATVRVKQVSDTGVLQLIVESHQPRYAERLAKSLPEAYLRYVHGNRSREVSDALRFAQNRLQAENDKLAKAELALQRFKQSTQIVSLDRQRDAGVTQAVDMATSINTIAVQLRGLEGQYAALRAARHSQPRYVETPIITTNPNIDILRDRLAALETQRSSLLVLYKPNHPQIQAVDAQINHLTRRLSRLPGTVRQVTRTVNPAIAAYDDKINETRAALAAKKAELAQARAGSQSTVRNLNRFSLWERQMARLERSVEQHKKSVALLAEGVEKLSIRENATRRPVSLISPAGPAEKAAPQPANILVAALLAGGMLGIVLGLLQEHLDNRVQFGDEAGFILQSSVLGFVPLIKEEEKRLLERAHGFSDPDPASALESYRVLRTNVQFATAQNPIRSLLVSSSVPGEGKTLTAANLAVAMALDGKSVILVDADLRAPTLHEKFDLDPQPGLTNVLRGERPLTHALQETLVRGLRVLVAGPLPPNPAELLHSDALETLHQQLKGLADIVIFDSPPLLAAADTQILSAELDGVLYVVQLGETTRPALEQAAGLLSQARANLVGVIFNKVDPGAPGSIGYGYYGYHRRTALPVTGASGSEQAPVGDRKRREAAGPELALVRPRARPIGEEMPATGASNRPETTVTIDREELHQLLKAVAARDVPPAPSVESTQVLPRLDERGEVQP